MKEVTEEYVSMCFQKGIDCSQIVCIHGAAKLGFDEKQAKNISAPLGGIWHGETCGCVIGPLMAI